MSETKEVFRPSRDVVLIDVDQPKTQTASGFYIQEEWKSLPPTGTVVAVGPDVKAVKPGHRVVFERYASVILPDDQRLCQESHIYAIIKEEKTRATRSKTNR